MVSKSKSDTTKSPKRDESPAKRTYRRSPARNVVKSEKAKSPSRKAKTPPPSPSRRMSPGRKSPARSRKAASVDVSSAAEEKSKSKSASGTATRQQPTRSKKPAFIEIDTDSDGPDLFPESKIEKPKATVRGRARRLDVDNVAPGKEDKEVTVEVNKYMGLARRSTRIANASDIERIVHLKRDTMTTKLSEFSDDDVIDVKARAKSERQSEPKVALAKQTARSIGSVVVYSSAIVLLPLMFIGYQMFCNKSHCSFKKLPNFSKYKLMSTYLDTTAMLTFTGFVFLVQLLSVLPVGGAKVTGLPNKQGKLEYRMNGLFSAVVISLTAIALEFYNIRIFTYIHDKYFQMTVASIIIGILFSLFLYVRSFFVPISALNPQATTNNKIYNFFMGRELNPRFLGIDYKMCYLRIACIGMFLINVALIYKSLIIVTTRSEGVDIKSFNFQPTLLLISIIHTIYALDALIFESSWLTTYEVQYEGVGYFASVGYMSCGFYLSMIPKYVLDYNVKLPTWMLVAIGMAFLVGYILFRGSNLQKHAFRQNPYSPALAHLETIPTSQGKKLLVSGYWGFVRHPNYLGDIIINLTWIPFVYSVPLVLICLFPLAFLIHRSKRDNARCQQHYGAAWDRYCKRVKYVLVPKVY